MRLRQRAARRPLNPTSSVPQPERQAVLQSLLGLGVLAGLLLSAGCQPTADIVQYTIPKAAEIQLPKPDGLEAPTSGSPSTAGRPERMLGAIVPQGSQTWFFKLSGPVDDVAAETEKFDDFVKSLKFDGRGEPEWTLPSAWDQRAGSGMRFSTIMVGDDPAMELSVIALPTGEGPLPPQILANINRWRGQLSLSPISLEKLSQETTSVTLDGGVSAVVCDFTGKSSGGGMMNAPFAGGGMGGSRPGLSPAPIQPEATALTYDSPAGWKQGRVGGLRKAAFELNRDGQSAEITVIDLPVDAGERLPNVNRWRGQVGLPEIDGEELQSSMQTLEIGPLKGDYVELIGDSAAPKPQTILGVIVDRGEQAWFIKLQGDSDLALSEKAVFEQFAQSIRFTE